MLKDSPDIKGEGMELQWVTNIRLEAQSHAQTPLQYHADVKWNPKTTTGTLPESGAPLPPSMYQKPLPLGQTHVLSLAKLWAPRVLPIGSLMFSECLPGAHQCIFMSRGPSICSRSQVSVLKEGSASASKARPLKWSLSFCLLCAKWEVSVTLLYSGLNTQVRKWHEQKKIAH